MRDPKFSILKALAIMLVVLSHAGISGWLFNFVFIFHVPAFFLCAGYFFNTRYLTDERTFVMHRVKKLYVPFLKWSVVLLLLHNVFFWCGLLSEQFGNAQGGVLLETADSDAVFAGFQNRVSVTVGTARAAGRYTDTLTFRFALV